MRSIILVAHNLRSCHNVGSLLRTADGLGAAKVVLSGYTPYPASPHDTRLPHEVAKIARQIRKTSLGAEQSVKWEWHQNLLPVLEDLKNSGYTVAALEQTGGAKELPDYRPPQKIAIILGRETEGLEPEIIKACDLALEIPMYGRKESFNVVQAAAMALYHCRFA